MKNQKKYIVWICAAFCMLMVFCSKKAEVVNVGSSRLELEDGKAAGLDGVEICLHDSTENLLISDATVRQKYKDEMAKTGLPIPSLSMLMLNYCPLATDPRAQGWLEQSIDAANDLGAKVILMPFFINANLMDKDRQLKTDDINSLVERLIAVAPRAEKAGVILGIENTLSAEQNLELLNRIGSPAVGIYYDVKNTSKMGYDVPAEIRLLKDHIAQIHFKNGDKYMGEDDMDFDAIAKAIKDINYKGWIVLETSKISGDDVADAKRESEYVRELFGGKE